MIFKYKLFIDRKNFEAPKQISSFQNTKTNILEKKIIYWNKLLKNMDVNGNDAKFS